MVSATAAGALFKKVGVQPTFLPISVWGVQAPFQRGLGVPFLKGIGDETVFR